MQPLSPAERYVILRRAMSRYLDGGYTVMWKSYNAACLVRTVRPRTDPVTYTHEPEPWADEVLCVAVDRFGNVATE